jgi:hypothetical protein
MIASNGICDQVGPADTAPELVAKLIPTTDVTISFPVSPYNVESNDASPCAQQESKRLVSYSTASGSYTSSDKGILSGSRIGRKDLQLLRKSGSIVQASTFQKPQRGELADPTREFELKILDIVRSQQDTIFVFDCMNSYVDGDNTISIRELSVWLPIKLSRLDNVAALKLAIKNAQKLPCIQESKAGSRDSLLAKLVPPPKDDRKKNLELEELPSFFENLLAYHRIAKIVSSIDPSGLLQLTKLEIFLFLKAIGISSSSEIGKGLIQKVNHSGCITFLELCRISYDLGFSSTEIRQSIINLSKVWDFSIEKPRPRPPLVRRIKPHDEVQKEMHKKILQQTRRQDSFSAAVVPYMVKSRLREIKQRQCSRLNSADASASSVISHRSIKEHVTIISGNSERPNSAGKTCALWKQGSTPRHIHQQKSSFTLFSEPSLVSLTQRSFEQGSILDTRRQNPLFIDVENGQTIYDMPVLSSADYMQYCPIGAEVLKRVVDQPEVNPLAFKTSRTPRLYGVHCSKPGITRREFFASSQSNPFFHNVDINIRRQYRPCTAGSLQESIKNNTAKSGQNIKPDWCFGCVPWNGKSSELPKYSGDIGFFEKNTFKQRFDTDIENIHLWTTEVDNNLLGAPKIMTAKLNVN